MNANEVIGYLEKSRELYIRSDVNKEAPMFDVIEIAIRAINKSEIPKEPATMITKYSGKNDIYCPCCKLHLNSRRKSDRPNFCSRCGQAVKNNG
ncbi:MAG: hypothetical protein AB9883_07870 [Acidaminococcaceae bacterium]